MSGAKSLLATLYQRIEHGDGDHKKWLYDELEKFAVSLEKDWLVLDPVEKTLMQNGMKLFLKYSNDHVSFMKIRSGQLEMTEAEKAIAPDIQQALKLLDLWEPK